MRLPLSRTWIPLCFAVPVVGEVAVHPVPPDEGATAPYRVTADGTHVPLERAGAASPVYYARFAAAKPSRVRVWTGESSPIQATVEPDRFAKAVSIERDGVSFTVEGAGPRIVNILRNGKPLPLLFVIAEPPEESPPKPHDPNVIDVTRYGVSVSRASATQTAGLQAALDACAARPKGGIVYVPAGRFLTGTLRVSSNTRLYLAGGAVLQAVDDPAAFRVDTGLAESGGEGLHHSHCRLLIFDRAVQSGIFGRGTLDGNGAVLRNRHDRRVQVIDAHDCRDLTIEGVVLRNTASWTLHLLHCTGVRCTDLKILADWDVPNSDGVDPDSCRDVRIERLFGYTGDDAIAVKTTGNSGLLRNSHDISVRDSVVLTKKTALKIGTETRANISRVRFENIDVVGSSRGMAVWVRDGGVVSDVLYRDIRLSLFEYPREGMSGQPIYLTNEKRHGEGAMKNIRFERIECRAPWWSVLESKAAAPIEDVRIESMKLSVMPRVDKKDVKPLFSISRVNGLAVRNLTVDWSEAIAGQWTGLWSDPAAVRVAGLRQIAPPTGR